MNLHEIAIQYRQEAGMLQDLDLDEQTLADTLEAAAWPLEVKAQNTAAVIQNLEATAEAIDEHIKAATARKKAIQNRAAWLREHLLHGMQLAGVQKIECPAFRISVANNPEAVDVYEAALIPAQYLRQPEPPPPAPDKAAIKQALQAGIEVQGARLVRGQRLSIK